MAAPADPESVGKAFIQYYYQLFESNRPALGNLYQDASMMTFEGNKLQGTANILQKLQSLPFGQCKVSLGTQDFQPSVSGGILVFVTGTIQVRQDLVLHSPVHARGRWCGRRACLGRPRSL